MTNESKTSSFWNYFPAILNGVILSIALWVSFSYLPSLVKPYGEERYQQDKKNFETNIAEVKNSIRSIENARNQTPEKDKQANFNKDSLTVLKQKLDILLIKYELLKQNYEKEVANQKQSFENESKKFINEVKQQNLFIQLLVYIVGAGTLIGIITSIILFFKQLHHNVSIEVDKQVKDIVKRQEDEIFQQVKDIIKTNPSIIKKIIEQENQEIQLIKNAKIKILTKSGSKIDFVKQFFDNQTFGFNTPEWVNEGNYKPEEVEKDNFDLLILYNDDSKNLFDLKNLEEYIKEDKTDKVFFYFGTGQVSKKVDNLGFANAKSQFYPNILNLLRYKQLSSDK